MFYSRRYLPLALLILAAGCDRPGSPVEPEPAAVSAPARNSVQSAPAAAGTAGDGQVENTDVEIGNKRYLFVLKDHSMEELHALLRRAEEIAQTSPAAAFDQLEIALVIHGPTANLFTRDSIMANAELIELAARLDQSHVMDVKICEVSLTQQGIGLEEIPTFIEPVPFAPDEIRRLTDEGYITL